MGFLSTLSTADLGVVDDVGAEISISDEFQGFASFLRPHLPDARFTATLESKWRTHGRWVALAHNKFDQPVAAFIGPAPETEQGPILLLPQFADPTAVVKVLLESVLPALSPKLFPHVEGANWVRRAEYELPKIVRLKTAMDAVERKAREDIADLERAVEGERLSDGFLHTLLTSSGDDLVAAVQAALERLGFSSVENVDETNEGSSELREDLRIHDRSPLLLVEVKGINALPSEADALQVTKYLAPRMKELERLDIQGLSVINHQRYLPALERQNSSVFQGDVLTNATDHGFGLLTTWDLYRLIRNMTTHGWTHEQVAPVLYRVGRIDPIPEHLALVGTVEGVWPEAAAVGVRVDFIGLTVGDTIAFEGKVDYVIQDVASLQLDGNPIDRAPVGIHAGIRVPEVEGLRDGMRVFRVEQGHRGSTADTST